MLDFSSAGLRSLAAPVGDLIDRCNPRVQRLRRVSEVSLVLLNLVQDLQLHRGLSGAILTGGGEFRGEREAVEHKLQRSLHALADYYGERHPVFRQAPWRIVLGRWESLRNNWRELSFATNLSVHGEVVAGILGILRDLAADHAQLLGEERAQVIRVWPGLVEHFGMLRALGLHLLCAGPTQDTVLRGLLAGRLQTTRFSLQTIAPGVGDPRPVAAAEAALERVAAVRDGALGADDAERFYAEMTALMEEWYRVIRGRIRPGDPPSSAGWRAVLGFAAAGKSA
jgi:hypothetical protein